MIFRLSLVFLIFICFTFGGCAKPILVRHGNLISVSKQTVPEENSNAFTLSIHWFGTANYYIRLGEAAILTDPFVSYQNLFRILFSGYIQSDPDLVKSMYGSLEPPEAIFIGHSHYDHMLDTVEALKLPGWSQVPVYGSMTTRNIIAGYKKQDSSHDSEEKRWSENWKEANALGEWIEVYPTEGNKCEKSSVSQSYKICYKAFLAEHAPQLPLNFKYFSGKVTKPLKKPPHTADEFKEGTTYVYLFKLVGFDGKKMMSYTLGLIGSATAFTHDLQRIDEEVDILILCVPGWQYREDYPGKLIEELKPKVIILSHFDDFFEPDRNKRPTTFIPNTRFYEFLDKIQDDINNTKGYDRFQKIFIPDVGTTLYFRGEW